MGSEVAGGQIGRMNMWMKKQKQSMFAFSDGSRPESRRRRSYENRNDR